MSRRAWTQAALAATGAVLTGTAAAQDLPEVALAGFAYAGSADTIATRYPNCLRYEEAQKAKGVPVFRRLWDAVSATPPKNLRITGQIESLRGKVQALAATLVIGNETVTVERFGALRKLSVILRGQTMLFDFKSMNVVRAYPVSFAYIDLLDHDPTPAEVDARIAMVFEGANGKPGLIARFAQALEAATVPSQVSRYLQVTRVTIKPEAVEGLPSFVKDKPLEAQTWLADMVGEAISTRAGVPVVPYAKGYAIGNVMALRVSDGTVWELKLPKPDYEIAVALSGFKKVKFSEVAGGATSFVYGAYADLRIEEPLSGKAFLSTALKNGETRVIPASQQYVDDAPHFYDALNGLFVKTALAMGGGSDDKWLITAAAAKDIPAQLSQAKELIKLCKQ